MAWFTCDAISKEFSWLPNFPSPSILPWKTSAEPKQRPMPRISASEPLGALAVCQGPQMATRPTRFHVPGWEKRETNMVSVGREKEREREILCLPGIMYSQAWEETRSFFKIANQLPKLSGASDGVYSLTNDHFPRLD